MKTQIKAKFERFHSTYERYAWVQKETAKVIGKHNFQGLGLDLGCGTGFLSEEVKRSYNFLIGVDLSYHMIKIYKDKGFKGVNADIENLPFKNESFDFAVSNFSLHWTNLVVSLKEIYRVIKKGGILSFSVPIKGSLEEVHLTVGRTFNFPDIKDISRLLLSSGFYIEAYDTKDYKLYFEDGVQLIKYFKYTGTALNKQSKSIYQKLQNYRKLKKQKNIETGFKVAFFQAKKPF